MRIIAIDLEAYELLRSARTTPDEPFSEVIKRARWPRMPRRAAAFLEAMAATPVPDPSVIEYWDEAQAADTPPGEARDAGPITPPSG